MKDDVRESMRSFRFGHRVCTVTVPWPRQDVPLKATCMWVPDEPRSMNRKERREFLKEFTACLHAMSDELLREARRLHLLLDPDPVPDPDDGEPRWHPGDPRDIATDISDLDDDRGDEAEVGTALH